MLFFLGPLRSIVTDQLTTEMKCNWLFLASTRLVSPLERSTSCRSVVVSYQLKELSRVTPYPFIIPLFLTLGTVRLEVDVMIDSNILKFVVLIRILCSQFFTHIDRKYVF